MQLCRQLADAVFSFALKKTELFQVVPVLQEACEKHFIKVDDVTFHFPFKMPTVYLPGRHKIDLERFYREPFKINGVASFSFGKKYQVIKGMAVLPVKVLVMLFQVRIKALNQEVLLGLCIDAADVVNRYGSLCHSHLYFLPQRYAGARRGAWTD